MYEFLLARRAEAADDVEGGRGRLRARRRARPGAADLHAELAGFYARQNRAERRGDRGRARPSRSTPTRRKAHRILGLVNAAWADGVVDGPAGGSEAAWRADGHHASAAGAGLPAMATDIGLQLTLARQLLGGRAAADAVPLLERLVSQTGPAGEPASMLAEALRSLGQLERATTVLEQAAAANPRYFMALGDIYERQSKFEEAAEAFDRGAKAMRTPGRELRLRRVNALLGIPDGKGADRAVTALTEYLADDADGRGGALPAGAGAPAARRRRGRRRGRPSGRWPSSRATCRR